MLGNKIREPTTTQISECIKVLYTSFGRNLPKEIKEEEETWITLIKNNIGKFLIFEENGNIVGIGGVFLFEKVCSFGYMGVLPQYRGKGIGTNIFGRLFNLAKESGYNSMILYASKLGEPIYKKFGFQGDYYGIMYHLPTNFPQIGIITKEVKVLREFPDWL